MIKCPNNWKGKRAFLQLHGVVSFAATAATATTTAAATTAAGATAAAGVAVTPIISIAASTTPRPLFVFVTK